MPRLPAWSRRRPGWLGSGSGSPRRTTELPLVHRGDRVPPERSRLWWCAGFWHPRFSGTIRNERPDCGLRSLASADLRRIGVLRSLRSSRKWAAEGRSRVFGPYGPDAKWLHAGIARAAIAKIPRARNLPVPIREPPGRASRPVGPRAHGRQNEGVPMVTPKTGGQLRIRRMDA